MTRRVLLADDAAELRLLLSLLLESQHDEWEVVAQVADGAAAVSAAREVQPDLVLLDLAMPVRDGLEVLPDIRAAAPAACIVVLTGFADDELAQAAKARGADAYMVKTDIVDALLPALHRLFEQQGPLVR